MLCSTVVGANSQVEQAIKLFNQKEYSKALPILEKESERGSASATFWLAVTQYRNRQQFEAGSTFLKAAEMGDPWAMDVLAGNGNSPCKYLGWQCDESWTARALPIWQDQAQKGNGKAMYQLVLRGKPWWEIVPIYRYTKYREIYTKAIPAGGYRFLFSNVAWESQEERVKYLIMAAKKGYAPAMVDLYYNLVEINLELADEWVDKAIDLGYAKAAQTQYFTYSLGRKNIEPDVKKAYYYNRLSGALGGDEDPTNTITQENVVDDYGYPISDEEGNAVMRVLITPEEQAKLDSQVIERVKDIKPNMFLDETSIDLF